MQMVDLLMSFQCTLCVSGDYFCVGNTKSVNGKCYHCRDRKQACSLAGEVAKGRPRQGEGSQTIKNLANVSKSCARKSGKNQKSAIKAEPQKLHKIVVPPRKRKDSVHVIEASPTVRKRARLGDGGPEPLSSRLSVAHAPPPAPQPYASATRVLGILRDAMSAADCEVRRQMAMSAGDVGLEDLMALLLAGASDGDVKDKGKERLRK